jgi:hypothetical protein
VPAARPFLVLGNAALAQDASPTAGLASGWSRNVLAAKAIEKHIFGRTWANICFVHRVVVTSGICSITCLRRDRSANSRLCMRPWLDLTPWSTRPSLGAVIAWQKTTVVRCVITVILLRHRTPIAAILRETGCRCCQKSGGDCWMRTGCFHRCLHIRNRSAPRCDNWRVFRAE